MLFTFHFIFLRLAKQSQFIPLQNVVYFITLPFFCLFVKYSHFTQTMCYYLNVQFQGQRVTVADYFSINISWSSSRVRWLNDERTRISSTISVLFIRKLTAPHLQCRNTTAESLTIHIQFILFPTRRTR